MYAHVEVSMFMKSQMYLDIAVSKGDSTAKVVSSCKMPVKWCWVELGENVHFVDPTIDAVAHWHINEPVRSSNWNLQ